MAFRDLFGGRQRVSLDLPEPAPVQLAKAPEPPAQVVTVIFADDFRKKNGPALRELPSYSRISWETVAEVRQALHMLMQGQFNAAAELVDAMQGDDRITGVLSARLDGLLGTALEMKTPEGEEENKTAIEIAETARELWPTMAPESSLRELMRWGRLLGVAPYETLPVKGDPWTRRMKVWHPRFLYWVPNIARQPYSGSFKLITGDGLVDLDLDESGQIRSTNPDGSVELGRFGLFCPFGYHRAWVHGLVRALAIPWLIRNYAIRDWARYSEIHGIPIRAVSMPADMFEPKERERAEAEIAALGSDSVVRLPVDKDGKGFKLELIEPKAQSEEAFEKLIAKCDTAIAVAILGQNLTTEIGTSGSGSRAAAQVHDRVRSDIVSSDAETLATTAREQLLAPWTEHHYGDPSLAPWPHWAVDPPEDEGAKATAFLQVAQGVQALVASRLNIDWAEQAERLAIPLAEGDPILEPDPVAPPPDDAGAGGPPGNEPPAKGKGALSRMALARKRAGAEAGQAYADALAAVGATRGAELLAGDVKALRKVLAEAKAKPDGTIDGPALKAALLEAYKDMQPGELAHLVEKLSILARLQGRLSVLEDL
jgi:phage gp29-like protein